MWQAGATIEALQEQLARSMENLAVLQVRRANTEQASAQRLAAAADQIDALRAEAARAADRAAAEATSTAARVLALEERLRTERAAAQHREAASADRQASLQAELQAAARQTEASHVAAQQAAAGGASAAEQVLLATGEVVSLRHQLLDSEEQSKERGREAAAARQRLAELEEQVCLDETRTPMTTRTVAQHF